MILDGKYAAACIKEQLKQEISTLKYSLKLAIIHFNDGASASYLKGRLKLADELKIHIETYLIDIDKTTQDLQELIHKLNEDNTVHGIMIDRPLPSKYNEQEIISLISPKKDVDGYTPYNLGKLFSNQNCFLCATPMAAIRLLEFYNIDVSGKDVLIIGRSINVGKPLALILLNKNATVTIAHSKTKNLKDKCQKAEIIFLAVGHANFLNKKDVNENTIIVDIGINYDEYGKLCGDASKDCYEIVKTYSPVPGGVGVLTNVVLMENLLKAAKQND